MLEAMDGPTIVSAFGGSQYYHDAARRLLQDCKRLGLPSDIVEWEVGEQDDWVALCRRKVRLYPEALARNPNGILWVDIDTRILKRPDFAANLTCDIGGFVRGFECLRDFDPAASARFFVPGYLYFGHTKAAIWFLERMALLERENPELAATDDFFLQEAWLRFGDQLCVTVFPPKYVQVDGRSADSEAVFTFSPSENALRFKGQVQQHAASVLGTRHKLAVLSDLARTARRNGDKAAASVFTRTLLGLNYDSQSSIVAAAKALPVRDWSTGGRALFQSNERSWTPPFIAKRAWVEKELKLGEIVRARLLCLDLASSPEAEDRAFAASKLYRIELEERAAREGLGAKDRPLLAWMEQPYPGNFGDVLGPYIVEKLTGRPPRYKALGRGGSILSVGSIIKYARAGSKVWGSGTARASDILASDAVYLAVRGPLTREAVLRSGGTCPEVYGDPAWFLPDLYRPVTAKHHALGLIRHVNHRDRNLSLDGVLEIDLRRVGDVGIEGFVDEVLSCEKIISTSLHGLIVAHAYGVPAEWAVFEDGLARPKGDRTKYEDYFRSVGLAGLQPIDLASLERLTDRSALSVSTLPRHAIDVSALARAAPFEIAATKVNRSGGGDRAVGQAEHTTDPDVVRP